MIMTPTKWVSGKILMKSYSFSQSDAFTEAELNSS